MKNNYNATNQNRMMARDSRGISVGPRTMRQARDASTASPSSSGNVLGRRQQLRQFGWIGPTLSECGATARYALSLNPDNDVIIANTYPLECLSTSPASLINACMLAVQGDSGKTYASYIATATQATTNQTIDLTTNTKNAFGAFVRISNSTTNFGYGTYEIQLANNATVMSSILIQVTSLPVEVIILAISNNAGKGSVTQDPAPKIIIPFSNSAGVGNLNYNTVKTADIFYAETLNMRDIGNVVDAMQQGAILI
jgi:hypothetical protein